MLAARKKNEKLTKKGVILKNRVLQKQLLFLGVAKRVGGVRLSFVQFWILLIAAHPGKKKVGKTTQN